PKVVFAIIESEKIGMGPKGARPVGTGYLGFAGRTEEDRTEIIQVAPDSPAAKAGIKVGDELLAVGDKTIRTYADLLEELQEMSVGDKLKLKIGRGAEKLDVELTVAERPTPAGGAGLGGRGGQGGADPNRPFGVSLGGQREN